ncbi:MAG: hypothetical protein D6705_04855 [Deltaproteobacteria bacterium]|nr:MAG: hypothetical protein D6705_04855 [Deltaproteobacteria bacterium]
MDRRLDRGALLCALCLFLLSWALPAPAGFVSHNERPRLLAGRALVEDGRLDLDAPSVAHLDPGMDVSRGADGRRYPNKAPGTTFVAAATWLVARHAEAPDRTHRILSRIVGATLPAVLLLLWLCRLPDASPERRRDRRAATVLVFLASPLWPYAKVFYGHALAALLVYGAYRLGSPRREGLAAPAAAGLCAGLSVCVEYTAAAFCLPLALAVFGRAWIERRARIRLVAGLVGAMGPAAALAGYHLHAFGGIWRTGYHHALRPEFAEIHARGVLGFGLPTLHSLYAHVLSPSGGLLTVCPLLVLGVWSRRPVADHEAPSARFLPLVAVAVLLGLAQTGGFRVGPRYIVAAMPLFVPNLAENLPLLRRRPAVAFLAGAAATAGIAICGTAASVLPHLPAFGDPWSDLLVPLARSGVEVPTALGHLPAALVAGASVAGAIVLCTAAGTTRNPPRARRAWLAGAATALLLLALRAAAPTDEGSRFCRALADAGDARVPCP